MSHVQSRITTTPDSKYRTFHPFSRLAPELQLMIWRLALPRGRIIKAFPDNSYPSLECLSQQRDPSILQVSHQSRDEALRFFEPRDQPNKGIKYFSPVFDILHIDHFYEARYKDLFSTNINVRLVPRLDFAQYIALTVRPSYTLYATGLSLQELQIAEHIALRLRTVHSLYKTGLHFFADYLTVLWYTSSLRDVTVIVDDIDDDFEDPWLRHAVSYAAELASEKVITWKRDEGVTWVPPNVELVTQSYFEVHFIGKALNNFWSMKKTQDNPSDKKIIGQQTQRSLLSGKKIRRRKLCHWPISS